MKRTLILILLLAGCFQLFAQEPSRLSEKIIKRKIMGQTWMMRYDENAETRYFQLFADSMKTILQYDGESGVAQNCKFRLVQIKNNIFEIEVQDCRSVRYIYGYLSGSDKLYLQEEEERLKISSTMAGGKQWFLYRRQ